jgi:CysZ protein
VLGACVAGWMLTVELTSVAFDRRGYGLPKRLRLLCRYRALALGFGVPILLLFLLPFGAVIGMPRAVAGGTLIGQTPASACSTRRAGQPPAAAPWPCPHSPDRPPRTTCGPLEYEVELVPR